MKILNSRGFGVVEGLLIFVLVGIIGGAGYFVYKQNQDDNKQQANISSSDSQNQTDNKVGGNLVLIESILPKGWSTDVNQEGSVIIKNSATKCFVDVLVTSDTTESNSSEIDQNKQTIDAIKSKGYSVEQLANTKLKIKRQNSEQSVDAYVIKVFGLDNPMLQKYAYIFDAGYFIRVQVSCPDVSGMSDAEKALLAVEINK